MGQNWTGPAWKSTKDKSVTVGDPVTPNSDLGNRGNMSSPSFYHGDWYTLVYIYICVYVKIGIVYCIYIILVQVYSCILNIAKLYVY